MVLKNKKDPLPSPHDRRSMRLEKEVSTIVARLIRQGHETLVSIDRWVTLRDSQHLGFRVDLSSCDGWESSEQAALPSMVSVTRTPRPMVGLAIEVMNDRWRRRGAFNRGDYVREMGGWSRFMTQNAFPDREFVHVHAAKADARRRRVLLCIGRDHDQGAEFGLGSGNGRVLQFEPTGKRAVAF
jgi:hypothetical protein